MAVIHSTDAFDRNREAVLHELQPGRMYATHSARYTERDAALRHSCQEQCANGDGSATCEMRC